MKKINVLSLFDGLSAGQIALNRANIQYENYFASEIDKYAIKVTQTNYPNTIQLGDVRNIDLSKLPKIDLLIGGSPCTYWSISKKDREITSDGLGFELFMYYIKALKVCNPKYFLYENNHSIHQNINDAISEKLNCEYITINSSLVSGQQRKRCYWTNIPNIKQPNDKNIYVKDILEFEVDKKYYININIQTSKIISTDTNKPIRIGQIGKGGQGERIYSIDGKSVNLTANGGGRGAKTGLYLINNRVRRLSPAECEKLQTIDENYTNHISDNQRYKCLGNSWTVDVIVHIFKNMEF